MKYLLVLIMVCLCGCTSTQQYRGPKLESNEIAVLEKDKDTFGGIIVNKINGKKRGLGTSDRFEFMPGQVELTVGYVWVPPPSFLGIPLAPKRKGSNAKPITLTVDMEAGKVYQLEYLLIEHGWTAWVVDKETGEVVSK